ncbi:MAG TPA: hypothetical protein VFI96_04305 [Longimicrobiaceae bacterium]|nr:hypothetical protein [Longimicrobiaceae bacterium]
MTSTEQRIHVSVTLDTGTMMGTAFNIPASDDPDSAGRVWACFIGWPVVALRVNGREVPVHAA